MAIKSNLQWQAEDDARTMARYQEIISDKARLKRATTAARKEAANSLFIAILLIFLY